MINDPTLAYLYSDIPIDQVVGTFEGSFVASPPPGGFTEENSEVIQTGISESTFFQGIYSIDSGTTWRDFNVAYRVSGTTELRVFGISEANELTIRADNSSFVLGNSYTVMYKVALLSKFEQGEIEPQPIGGNVVFDSRLNYQKIASDTMTVLSIADGATSTTTIAHNLGYVPKVRGFIEIGSSYGADTPEGMYEAQFLAGRVFSVTSAHDANTDSTSGIYLNETNVYLKLRNNSGRGAFTGTFYMRIYYDA